jgi:lipopolysaccharide export system protein LptC
VRLSSTRLFPMVLMLVLALLSFWLERTSRVRPVPAEQGRHDPDYSVEQFTITDFSRAGAPESTLSASKMVHFPDDDSTVLVAPHLVQTRSGQPRLDLSADRGTLSRDGAELSLYDNVLAERDAAAGTPPTRIRTTYLQVVRARSLVRTDREVQVSEPGRTLFGRGMEYDNVARQLSLHAQVRGSFEARQW